MAVRTGKWKMQQARMVAWQTLGYNMGAILQKYLQHYVKNR